MSPDNNPSIELTLEPGLYVFNMFVDWLDYGSVNYGFLVAVEGALRRDSTAFVDDQGLPLDEATYRTRFEETIGEFQSLLMADLTDTYGGLWVEQQPEYRIVIGVNEGAPAKVITQSAAETTAVSGPDVNGQVDEDDQDPFKESWIELHELKG